jgi:hypothetical protein
MREKGDCPVIDLKSLRLSYQPPPSRHRSGDGGAAIVKSGLTDPAQAGFLAIALPASRKR